jgi:insulysin
VLREKHWVQDLSADDVSYMYQNFSIFALSLELTEEGFDHVNDILRMIFYYIDTVLENIPDWVYDELKVSGESAFRFLGKYPGSDTCSSLSNSMHMYDDSKYYLSGAYKYYEYDPAAVAEIRAALRTRSSNILIMLGSSSFESTATETDCWYGTKYRCVQEGHPIIDLMTEATSGSGDLYVGLTLPARNDMLPENFDLLSDRRDCDALEETSIWKNAPENAPRCLVNEPSLVLWYKADFMYNTPKVSITVLLRSPLFTGGPRVAIMASLWAEIASELCNDFSYNASMAGLHCQFSDSVRGVQISVGGYNDKAGTLMKLIFEKICNPKVEAAFFERLRKKVAQSIQSALVSPPYTHGSMAANLVLESVNNGFLQEQLAFLLNERLLGVDEMKQFSKALLFQSRIDMFVHGNVNAEEAKSLSEIVVKSLQPVITEPLPLLRAIELPPSSLYRLEGWNDHDENSCVVISFQIGAVNLREDRRAIGLHCFLHGEDKFR